MPIKLGDMFPEISGKTKKSDSITRRFVLERNWNNKLLCSNFIFIVPVKEEFEIGEKLDIRIQDRFFCYATISSIKTFKLSELISLRYDFIGYGLKQKEFMELMSEKYKKRKWWEEQNTKMQVMFMSKVEQINMNF